MKTRKLIRINYLFSPEEEAEIASIMNAAQREGFVTTPLLVLRRLVSLGIEAHKQQAKKVAK